MAQEPTKPHNTDDGGETRTEKAERKEENRQEKKDEQHQTGAGRHRGTNAHGTE